MAVRRQIRCLCTPFAVRNHPGRKNYLPPAVMRRETTLRTVQVRRLSRALGSPRLVQCFRSFGSFWEDWFKSGLSEKKPNTKHKHSQLLSELIRHLEIEILSLRWRLPLPEVLVVSVIGHLDSFAETINSNQLCRTTQGNNGPRRLVFSFRKSLIHSTRLTPNGTDNNFMIFHPPARSARISKLRQFLRSCRFVWNQKIAIHRDVYDNLVA